LVTLAALMAHTSTEAAAQMRMTVTIENLKSAEMLQEDCAVIPSKSNSLSMVQKMSCISYVTGVIDTVETLRVIQNTPRRFCLPRNALAGDAVKVVSVWLRNHRNSGLPASEAVIRALENNYSCER
jgi:hypothetical protein